MKLKDLLKGIEIENLSGRNGIEIKSLACDSKKVRPGDLFIALKGMRFDGHDFVEEASQRGAACLVVNQDFTNPQLQRQIHSSIAWVKDTRKILSALAKNFYSKSIEDMKLIGVTGTNGKTTITYLLESILKASGRGCGVIGTINYRFSDRLIPATNTTPGLLDIYSILSQMNNNSVDYCVLEASSHSLDQGRVDGLLFNCGIFTNLTAEHLDYHRTLEDYLGAKIKLFNQIKDGGCCVINIDDPSAKKVIASLKETSKIFTYGIGGAADAVADQINERLNGLEFKIRLSGKTYKISSNFIGLYNVYNILAAFCCAVSLGIDFSEIIEGIAKLLFVPGRLERIDCGQNFLVFVDYAHTEDGLENVLLSLRRLCKKRLLVVFGCGGDRDRAKRPLMGKIAAELADKVFLTSDNPRSEDPEAILSEIVKGIPQGKTNYELFIDREEAIRRAISQTQKDEILLIAGKGHETVQIFKDRVVPFDDRKIVREILEGFKNGKL